LSSSEFELIRQHLSALGANRADVRLGVGDDAALIAPTPSADLRCACMCVALCAQSAQGIGHVVESAVQQLSSVLRDAGFIPAWATLALTLARADDRLVRLVADAVHRVCLAHDIAVIGGDTTSGEASLTIFLTGQIRIR
jgi:thiamine-monophosphate kinase